MSIIESDHEKNKTREELLHEISCLKRKLAIARKNNLLNPLIFLAGNIAHEYNNILTIISGNIGIAKTCECVDEELLGILQETESALRRASELTEKLKILSKESKPDLKPLSLHELLKKMTDSMLRDSPVSCRLESREDLWEAEVDRLQMKNVFRNLLVREKEELASGGEISIRLENILIEENEIPGLSTGCYVKIEISDHGRETAIMYPKSLSRLSFPDKNNKNELNLITAIEIIKRHRGFFALESQEGKGTTFSIFLPAHNPT